MGVKYAHQVLKHPVRVLQYVEDADDGELVEDGPEDLYLEKAWHGLHYLLTGLPQGGPEPWNYLLAGGEPVGGPQNHAVGKGPARILLPAQVAAFHEALAALTPEKLTARFDPIEMMALKIYPEIWDGDAAQTIDWLRDSYTDLQDFVQRVAQQNEAILINLEEVADLRPTPSQRLRRA